MRNESECKSYGNLSVSHRRLGAQVRYTCRIACKLPQEQQHDKVNVTILVCCSSAVVVVHTR